MNRIHNFSEFNSLYEAKIYDKTLELIITTILNAYTSELEYPAKSYSAIKSDIDSVKSATLEDKANAFVKIMNNVKNASADNKIEGSKEAVDAWVAAGTKATEAIKSMIAKYKDSPEEADYIKKFIETQLDEYFEEVKDADKENELKKDIAGANESNIHLESDEIFEGFLQGKKGRIEDVAKQITLVNAKLASLAQIPGMEDEVQKLQSEVNQISAKMGDLLTKKNKDINKQDIINASERLAQIPGELDKVAEEMLKQDSTNKEASAILVQALLLAQEATNKEIEYLKKKGEAEEKVRSEKIQVKIDGDSIEYNQDQMNVPNPQVKKFQDLVMDSFKNIKSVTDLPFYKKMGNSGKYGPNTRDMVKFLKAGFGLKDKSGDITKELIDEIQIQKETIKESFSSRIYNFSAYVNISEAAFDLSKGLEFAKTLPTYKSKGSSGGGSGITSAAKGAVGKMEKSASKEEIKAAEGTQFADKSAEEKWKWLTDTYKAGFQAVKGSKKVASAKASGSGDGRILKILWEGTDPTTKVYTSQTECMYPKSGENLGAFIDTQFSSGLGVKIASGFWGDKIDVKKKSASGNFLYEYEMPKEDIEKFKLQAANVKWLSDNFKTTFEKRGTVKDNYITKKNVPLLRFTVTKYFTPSSYLSFKEGEYFEFRGNGLWFKFNPKEGNNSIDSGTWKYDPAMKDSFTMIPDSSKRSLPIEKKYF